MPPLTTQLRATWLFYRSVAPFTLGITAALAAWVLLPLLLVGRAEGQLPALFLAKLLTGPAVWYLSEQARPHQYYFYYNLGLSRRRLWAGVAVLDGLLFAAVLGAVKTVGA